MLSGARHGRGLSGGGGWATPSGGAPGSCQSHRRGPCSGRGTASLQRRRQGCQPPPGGNRDAGPGGAGTRPTKHLQPSKAWRPGGRPSVPFLLFLTRSSPSPPHPQTQAPDGGVCPEPHPPPDRLKAMWCGRPDGPTWMAGGLQARSEGSEVLKASVSAKGARRPRQASPGRGFSLARLR